MEATSRMTPAVTGAALALGLLTTQLLVLRLSGSEPAARVVLPLTLALVPLALWPHRRWLGIWVIYVGITANLAAIVANGGLMPIDRGIVVAAIGEERAARYEVGRWIPGSKDVLLAPGEGRFRALGDQIVVRLGDNGIAASPGDVVIAAGLLVLAAEASLAWHARASRRQGAPAPHRPETVRGGAAT